MFTSARFPPIVTQYKIENGKGRIFILPEFEVNWHGRDEDEGEHGIVTFDISGINKQVAQYFNVAHYAPTYPRLPLPANYFDMLGVPPPTNDAERLGWKPLPKLPKKDY